MTAFDHFCRQCKTRHDFSDQIQVRYHDDDGETYDTWVSGSEALQRLHSLEVEDQLRSLSRLSPDELRLVVASLPEAARSVIHRTFRDELADRLRSGIGGNIIGDLLSDAVRGETFAAGSEVTEKERWPALLRYEPFRQIVLELAWIQLEGSLPDTDASPLVDDWV